MTKEVPTYYNIHRLILSTLFAWFVAVAITSEALFGWNDPIAAAILIVGISALVLGHLHVKNLL